MMSEDTTPQAYYVTALDRIGLAILAGGILTGLVALLLVVAGGGWSPAVLGPAWALGAVVAMIGIVAVAGPVWVMLHLNNLRGPGVAAATAALLALAIVTAGQLWGATLGIGGGYRLASALASSTLVALAAAAIGAAMQRVAYRRLL